MQFSDNSILIWSVKSGGNAVSRQVYMFSLGSFCSNTGSTRDNPYWTSRKNSLELIELSGINKVSLV